MVAQSLATSVILNVLPEKTRTEMRIPRLQFRFKHLFLAIAIIGIFLGRASHQARVQREAVRAILRVNGYVGYDQPLSTIPSALVRLFGTDMVCTVTDVGLYDVSNDDLLSLESLPHIKTLRLRGRKLDAAALNTLQHLSRLEVLSLGMPLNDENLDSLITLQNLKEVCFIGMGPDSGLMGVQSQTERVIDCEEYETELSTDRMKQFAFEHPKCKNIAY
jgi:hypothetical protein